MTADPPQLHRFSSRIGEGGNDFPKIEARCQHCGFTLVESVTEGLHRHEAAHAAECQAVVQQAWEKHAANTHSGLPLKLRCQ